jgi:hypothetical protein
MGLAPDPNLVLALAHEPQIHKPILQAGARFDSSAPALTLATIFPMIRADNYIARDEANDRACALRKAGLMTRLATKHHRRLPSAKPKTTGVSRKCVVHRSFFQRLSIEDHADLVAELNAPAIPAARRRPWDCDAAGDPAMAIAKGPAGECDTTADPAKAVAERPCWEWDTGGERAMGSSKRAGLDHRRHRRRHHERPRKSLLQQARR